MTYDRENSSIEEGVVFPSAVECRNAVATFSIKSETESLFWKVTQQGLLSNVPLTYVSGGYMPL